MPPQKVQCDICKRYFVNKYVLKRHLKCVHRIGIEYFHCDICNHASKRQDDLEKHKRVKHAAKPTARKHSIYNTPHGKQLVQDAINAAIKPSKNTSTNTTEISEITGGPNNHASNSPTISIIHENKHGSVLEIIPTADIDSIQPSYYFRDKDYLNSDDETPTRDELPTPPTSPKIYQPIIEDISPANSPVHNTDVIDIPSLNIPNVSIPYVDYSTFAIDSPERIKAMTSLFKGSTNLLLDDLYLSNDSNSSTMEQTTTDYRSTPTYDNNAGTDYGFEGHTNFDEQGRPFYRVITRQLIETEITYFPPM